MKKLGLVALRSRLKPIVIPTILILFYLEMIYSKSRSLIPLGQGWLSQVVKNSIHMLARLD